MSRDLLIRLKNMPKHNFAYWLLPRQLTMTHLEKHLNNRATIYYRNGRRNNRWLLKIDIDGKKEGQNTEHAELASEFIARKLHKGLYEEPSTGGKGRHIYLVVERGCLPHTKWKALLAQYVATLQQLIAKKRWKVSIDPICGLPTKLSSSADNDCNHVWTVHDGDFGILAKCPRVPMNELGLNHLVTSPVLKAEDFQRVIDQGMKASSKSKATPLPSIRGYNNMLTKVPAYARINSETIRQEPDALKRMHFAWTCLTFTHKRLPIDELELMSFYEDKHFHTGMSDKDRRLRYRRAKSVDKYRKTRMNNVADWAFGFDSDIFLSLVRSHVRPEHYADVKCDREISELDLAVALYVTERNAMRRSLKERRQGTTGFQSIIDMSKALRDAGVLPRACNANQACAARKILVNAGLTVLEDGSYYAGGAQSGWCRKFGVGDTHPRREYYEQFRAMLKQEKCDLYHFNRRTVIEVSDDDSGKISERVVFNADSPKGSKQQALDLTWELAEPVRATCSNQFAVGVVKTVEATTEEFWGPVETVNAELTDFYRTVNYSPHFDP